MGGAHTGTRSRTVTAQAPPARWGERLAAAAPGLVALSSYRARWLRKDLTAGLVLTALLVPQGMAYAELAGLPAITGLYTSILCLVGYAVFGPSRILVLGPDSSLGPMIAATILPLVGANGDPARAVALASALALLSGVITMVAGLSGFGFVADLISKPTMIGYMNGLALTILVGQLPKLFGFSVDASGFLGEAVGFVRGVLDGATVPPALMVGGLGLLLILALQRTLPKLPAILVVVVLSIGVTAGLGLDERGVDVVGVLPQGFPPLTIPAVGLSDVALLLAGALGIAVVSLADTISTASAFAARAGRTVDGGREMTGIGAANIAAGLFQGFPVSTSGSRTAVAEQTGAKSQVTGLVGAVAITLILVFAPGLLRDLPQPTLAAIVIVASFSLADLRGTMRLHRLRRTEFALSVVAFLGVVALGVLPGIAVAVALSIGNVFRRAWWPYQAVLGRVPGVPGLHDVRSYPQAELLPGCVVFRFDAPLFFANARTFREQVTVLTRPDPPPTWVIVAAEPITDVDTTAADMLHDLDVTLNARGVHLVFAEMKDPVREKIDRYELTRTIDPSHFFPTVEAAVAAFRAATGADWRSAREPDSGGPR
ncbi:SulP family inorganic anion transporter [Pseudonocardia xinjiangensis]|uniref:SulP family inorganic anion transporter n=1 Tax=Pseudonocardia xinjiangensis TaxID=75289 RepID=UPI003D8D8585